jgi:tetratricopeptide (TPR) repeat protein
MRQHRPSAEVRRFVVIIAIALVLCPSFVGASEESALLVSQGLAKLNQKDFAGANALFDAAVRADARDALARYHRGVSSARLGRLEAAIDDLRQVASEQPELSEAGLELGIALVRAGRYREALSWLQQADFSASPIIASVSRRSRCLTSIAPRALPISAPWPATTRR